MLGAAIGLALCWAVGAVAPVRPGPDRAPAARAGVGGRLRAHEAVPPERVMDAVGRIDPFAALAGPDVDVGEPDPAIAGVPPVRAARNSSCASRDRVRARHRGLRLDRRAGARRHECTRRRRRRSPVVDRGSGNGAARQGRLVRRRNDIAIVSVPGLGGPAAPAREREVAAPPARSSGSRSNGPYAVTPVRVGRHGDIVGRDAYGRFPVRRR